MEKYGRDGQPTDDNIVRSMRCACWIPKATNTHNIFCFPRPHCLSEHAAVLRHMYIACLDTSQSVVRNVIKGRVPVSADLHIVGSIQYNN